MAPARAALAGNPSDLYGGAVLAVTVEAFRAHASAAPAESLAVDPPSELVSAAVARFDRELAPGALASCVRWTTSIPQGVGLGGSSAIVIAVLLALCSGYGVSLGEEELARLALAIEVEDLGIAAGLQDRLAQACGGLTFMDFAAGDCRWETLARELLPPLVVAWRADAATESGPVHGDLSGRLEREDGVVVPAMEQLRALAFGARDALEACELNALLDCVNGSFDARRQAMPLDRRHVAMIELARDHGAAANYTGSGGAIVAVCRDPEHAVTVSDALARSGCGAVLVAG